MNRLAIFSIRQSFFGLMVINAVAIAAACYSYNGRSVAVAAAEQAYQTRYTSFLLASELRQNSSDLTNFARTFIVKGDSIYEDRYNEIIARRDGVRARQQYPYRIYWDLVLKDGKRPRGDGEQKSLLDAMKDAGFTAEELAKLEASKKASDDLIALEVRAMNAAKGIFEDANGKYTVNRAPDRAFALEIVYSDAYLNFVATIMKPVNEFFELLETRTGNGVTAAQAGVVYWGYWLLGSLCLILVSVSLTGVILLARVIKPMAGLQTTMQEIAGGDLALTVPYTDRGDEVAAMAKSVQVFKDGLLRNKALEREAEDARIEGEVGRKKAMSRLADSFQAAVGAIVAEVSLAATGLQSSATALTQAASETSEKTASVAASSQETSANVATVAAATEQLSASVQEISRQVSQSATIAASAVDQAQATSARVTDLTTAAATIGGIVGLIDEIASKTNLLALNATIEAARAGESGKGFAVVAQEVKSLAEQTTKATMQIQSQISSIQGATQETTTSINQIGRTIQEMSQIAATIASAVEEQGAATLEITRNIQQASAGTNDVASNIEQVSSAVDGAGNSARSVLLSATELSRLAGSLTSEAESFVGSVRAA